MAETTDRPLVVDVFAAAGLAARDAGLLPDALRELAVRLEIVGAGDLVAELSDTCWVAHDGQCPRCGHEMRPNPQPHPKPAPPPKPPAPPKPGR